MMNTKKRKIGTILLAFTIFVCVSATTVFAAVDPNVNIGAYIGYAQGKDDLVTGKAYAWSTNPNFSSINVNGAIYRGSSKLESGVGTATTSGYEASWFSNYYNHTYSYTLQTASRTYYTDGTSSSQSYASASW